METAQHMQQAAATICRGIWCCSSACRSGTDLVTTSTFELFSIFCHRRVVDAAIHWRGIFVLLSTVA